MAENQITKFEEAIKMFLDNYAEQDAQFGAKYQNPKKSIEECCKYITQQVAKQRGSEKCVAVKDNEVYGMAIHYYDEENIEMDKETPKLEAVNIGMKPETNNSENSKDKPAAKEKPKRGRKPKVEAKEEDDDIEIPTLDIPLF